MNQEVKTKWVEALRSGKYQQGQSNLLWDGKYCCLGVLCDIIDPDGWNGNSHRNQHTVPGLDVLIISNLSEEEIIDDPDAAESHTEDGGVYVISHLVNLNDRYDKTFHEIADWIEERL